MRTKRSIVVMALLLLVGSVALRGDGTFSPRAQRIGNQMICTCGCQQGALVCTTLMCPYKLQMQAEIRQRALLPESDSLILQSFVQEYGTQVIANPTHEGFNESAWVMPWVILGIGLALVLFFIHRFRLRHQTPATPVDSPHASELGRQIAAELEREIGKPPCP